METVPPSEVGGEPSQSEASFGPSESQQTKRPRRKRLVIYKLKQFHRDWIRLHYSKFVSKIGRRGAKGDTARAYTTNTITPRFMAEFHKDDDPEDEKTKKDQYEADYSIYVCLSNIWRKERRKLMKVDGVDGGDGAGGPEALRFNPQYLWAEANGDRIGAELEKRIDDDPNLAKDVGLWRRVVSELFHAESAEEQGKWKNQAQREKAQYAVATKSQEQLSDKEKMIYIKAWCTEMSALIKRGEARGGIQTLVHFGALEVKEEDGVEKKSMNFKSFTNPQINDYTRTKDFHESEVNFGNYVVQSMGRRVERQVPIAITPADDGAPVIPELPENPVLSLLRDLVRPAMKAHWRYAAGQGKVPWNEIARAIEAGDYVWVEKKRLPTELLPSGEKVRLVDPGEMTVDECIIWLRHLKRRQLGEPDTSTNFQFQQVYTTRTHVFPEWTKSTIKKPTRRAHVEVFLVKYKGYLDRPETYDPIRYNDNSWDYFYRDTGKAGLVHWMGLPARPKAPIPPQISSSEIEIYQSWFELIKETQPQVFEQIFSTLKLLNRLDKGVPIIAADELWRLSNEQPREVPLTIPQSPPSAAGLQQWLASPWVASYFLSPHEAGKTGTTTYFESWQHHMRTGPMYHTLSQTFRGGRLGVVWIIRGILKHLASVGAGAGVLKLPKDSPPGSDFTRTALADWDRATGWIDSWHSLIEDACKSLEATVRERIKPAVSSTGGGDDQATTRNTPPLDASSPVINDLDDIEGDMVQSRALLPRQAKSLVSYIDPYAELDEDRSEREESSSSSDSDEESSNLEKDESSLDLKLPKLLKPVPVKMGNYDGRTFVFGRNPKAKVVTIEPDPEQIRRGIDTYFDTTSDLFSTYTSMKSLHGLPYTSKLRDWIQENTSSLEEPRRHLVSTILLQRLTWRQAQVVWPKAESQFREFLEAFRQGKALLGAIQAAKDSRATGQDMGDILTREDELAARVWTTRLVFQQFKGFATISTLYANKLRDCFLTIPLNSSLSELKSVVAVIRDWRHDYSVITQELRERRKVINEDHQLDEYVPHVQNSWFWHGNPSGFVLSAKAEALEPPELVKGIAQSTEVVYEDEDEEELQDGGDKQGAHKGALPTTGLTTDEHQGMTGGQVGNVAQEGSSAKKMKRPKPKKKPHSSSPQPSHSPPPSSTAATKSLPVSTSAADSPIQAPQSIPASSPRSPPQSTSEPPQRDPPPSQDIILNPLVGDASPTNNNDAARPGAASTSATSKTKSGSKKIQKSTPVIELPKANSKGNGKSVVAKTTAKPASKKSEVTADESTETISSKKRKASTGPATVTKRSRAGKDPEAGEKSEKTGQEEEEGGGRPKRKRVQTARARGIA